MFGRPALHALNGRYRQSALQPKLSLIFSGCAVGVLYLMTTLFECSNCQGSSQRKFSALYWRTGTCYEKVIVNQGFVETFPSLASFPYSISCSKCILTFSFSFNLSCPSLWVSKTQSIVERFHLNLSLGVSGDIFGCQSWKNVGGWRIRMLLNVLQYKGQPLWTPQHRLLWLKMSVFLSLRNPSLDSNLSSRTFCDDGNILYSCYYYM